MAIIITKDSCDIEQAVCELVQVTEPSKIIVVGPGQAEVYYQGTKLGVASPTFTINVAGEYEICIPAGCNKGPVNVHIEPILAASPVQQPSDYSPDVEKITYCNPDTDTQWVKVCTYTFDSDGNPTETIFSDTNTGLVCGTEFEIRTKERCDPVTNTIWEQDYVITLTDPEDPSSIVETQVGSEHDTGVECNKEQEHAFDVCTKTDTVWIDNQVIPDRPSGGALYPQDNWTVDITLSNGSSITLNHPSTGAGTWSQNITQLAQSITTATGIPYSLIIGAGDDDDMNTPYRGHLSAEICAGSLHVTSVVATTVGGVRDGRSINLAVGVTEGDMTFVTRCVTKGEPDVWQDSDGNVIAEPDCKGCCDYKYAFPQLECLSSTIGTFCHIDPVDPDNPVADDVVQSGIFVERDCSGQVISYFTLSGDDPEPYEFETGYIGDCDTLSEVTVEPECEANVIAVEPKYDIISESVTPVQVEFENPTLFYWNFPGFPAPPFEVDDTVNHYDANGGFLGTTTVVSINPPSNDPFYTISVTPDAPSGGSFVAPDGNGTISCTEIQEIKEQQCDGSETYRYVIENGAGDLIEYVPQGEVRNDCPTTPENECTRICELGEGQCREVGSIGPVEVQSGLGISNSGTANHIVKHVTQQVIVDQINDWVNAGYIVIISSDQFGTAVVDTMGFYSPTGTTFTARADHTQEDACELFSQAVNGSANALHNMTYTAYEVGDVGADQCEVKVRGICSSVDDPIYVSTVPPEPVEECSIEYFLGCDDVNGDGSNIITYLKPVQTCYLSGVQVSQVALPFLDENLDEYLPVNPLTCDPASLDFDEEVFCDLGSSTGFIRRTIVVANVGAIVEEVQLDGLTPYVVIGPVQQGACPVFEQKPTVVPCGNICRALYNSGRGGVNVPGTTDFMLNDEVGNPLVGPSATFNEFLYDIREAGVSVEAPVPAYTNDGLLITNASEIVVTSANVSSFTYVSPVFGNVSVFFTCETLWASATKECSSCNVSATIMQREVCIETQSGVVEGYAIVEIGASSTEVLRLEDGLGVEVVGTVVECPCPCEDTTVEINCETCVSDSDIIANNGVFPLNSGGEVTVSGFPTRSYAGVSQAGCGVGLPAGAWATFGPSVGPLVLNFSEPVYGIRAYFGNVNANEAVTLSEPASCHNGVDCDGIVFSNEGFVASPTHGLSSHVIDYGYEDGITNLTISHNGAGSEALGRIEIIDCTQAVSGNRFAEVLNAEKWKAPTLELLRAKTESELVTEAESMTLTVSKEELKEDIVQKIYTATRVSLKKRSKEVNG